MIVYFLITMRSGMNLGDQNFELDRIFVARFHGIMKLDGAAPKTCCSDINHVEAFFLCNLLCCIHVVCC